MSDDLQRVMLGPIDRLRSYAEGANDASVPGVRSRLVQLHASEIEAALAEVDAIITERDAARAALWRKIQSDNGCGETECVERGENCPCQEDYASIAPEHCRAAPSRPLLAGISMQVLRETDAFRRGFESARSTALCACAEINAGGGSASECFEALRERLVPPENQG